MQTTLIDPVDLFRIVHFFDVLADVTASVLGACAYVALNAVEAERLPAMIAGFGVTFGVRGLAINYGWSLPAFRESVTRGRWTTTKQGPT
jgi:hypothetical protein